MLSDLRGCGGRMRGRSRCARPAPAGPGGRGRLAHGAGGGRRGCGPAWEGGQHGHVPGRPGGRGDGERERERAQSGGGERRLVPCFTRETRRGLSRRPPYPLAHAHAPRAGVLVGGGVPHRPLTQAGEPGVPRGKEAGVARARGGRALNRPARTDRACPHPAAPALIHHPPPPTFHHPTPPVACPAGPCIPGAGSGLSLRPARSYAP